MAGKPNTVFHNYEDHFGIKRELLSSRLSSLACLAQTIGDSPGTTPAAVPSEPGMIYLVYCTNTCSYNQPQTDVNTGTW